MPKKSKNISKWLTYEEVKAKIEYMRLFNKYYHPFIQDWRDRIRTDVKNKMKELYIEGDGYYTHVEQGFLIIDVTDGEWHTDLWYLVTSVFQNRISIKPTHVGV